MHPAAVILIAIGAFYVFAGIVATRAALISLFLDRALTAISGKRPAFRETALSAWLLGAANLVLAGGAALMLRLDLAVWLFAASLAGQIAYLLVLAPLYFDVDDPPDATGRRRTINATLIYAAATALVAWAADAGHLSDWRDAPWPMLAAAAAAIAAHCGYTLWKAASPIAPAADHAPDMESQPDPAHSKRIKVMADHYSHPLWAMDEGLCGDIAPESLSLSPELTGDLTDWAEAYMGSLNPDDPATGHWTDAQHRDHAAKARSLAIRLARERPDLIICVSDGAGGATEVHAADLI
ncbi:MAG: hypothetical protein ABL904_07460 [Hyphomicrobiaceae bacterium]